MKFEALIDSIKQSIATGISTPVRIVERTLLLDVISENTLPGPRYIPLKSAKGLEWIKAIIHNIKAYLIYISHSPYLNFIILLSAVVVSLLLLVAMISFFLSQVILPNPNQYVNDRGTLVFNQPLATEHYMFLLNSTDLWADSGIELIKGDKVEITVSGSFYSDIGGLCDSTIANSCLKYKYFHQNPKIKEKEKTDISKYLICETEAIGALLLRIHRPVAISWPLDSCPAIKGITRNENTHEISFVAPTSGILQFAVNDILLTSKERIDSIAKELPDLIQPSDTSNLHLYLDKYRYNMVRKWFDDNCGELLINVKVSRNVAKKANIPFYDKIFISLMRILD